MNEPEFVCRLERVLYSSYEVGMKAVILAGGRFCGTS